MLNLMRRGYMPGGGMLSPDGKTFVLNIPKNASTYVTNVLRGNEWTYSDIMHVVNAGREHVKCVVLLRDPVERWVSGFATYCASYVLGYGYGSEYFMRDYNDLTERIIFDNLVFDDHTEPQTTFVRQLPNQFDKQYILIKGGRERLIKNLSDVTGQELTVPYVDANVSEDTYDIKNIANFMRDKITPTLQTKIFDRYYQDYEMLNQVLINEPR
jgi:hypothetical protein